MSEGCVSVMFVQLKSPPPRSVAPRRLPPRSRGVQDAETHAWIAASIQRGHREDVDRAKAFARFDGQASFAFHGCASMVEYGKRMGVGAGRTLEYVAVGRVLAIYPHVEALLLDGSMCISTVAILAPLFTEPDLRPRDESGAPLPYDALLAWARLRTDNELRRYVLRRREEARVGSATMPRTIHFSSRGAADLERTQTLLSRKARRVVGASEAVQKTVRSWLERHDPLEAKPGTRRLPPMPPRDDGGRHPRSIPAEVRHALMAKYGDSCAIEHCEHKIWLENAHHLAHALGGGNEIADQDRICTGHHAMKDHGEILWIVDASYPGGGYYRTLEGAILRLKAPRAYAPGTGPPSVVGEHTPPLVASRRDGYRRIACRPWAEAAARGRRAPPRRTAAGVITCPQRPS